MSKPDSIYEAIVNTPGYLPMADDPTTFDSACEAWEWLAAERERGEESDASDPSHVMPLSGEWQIMTHLADPGIQLDVGDYADYGSMGADRVGTVYAGTPGYDGDHDLGLAYTVVRHDHELHCGAYPPAVRNPSLPCHACELLSMRED